MELDIEGIPIIPPLKTILSWIYENKIIYLLPYYDDEKEQEIFRDKIHSILEKFEEDYKIINVYCNSYRYTCITMDEETCDVKLDYIETELKKLKKEEKKKIVIVI